MKNSDINIDKLSCVKQPINPNNNNSNKNNNKINKKDDK